MNLRPPSQMPRQDEFCVALDSDERIRIADGVYRRFVGALVAFFFLNETPKLIGFYVLHAHVANLLRKKALTALAREHQKLEDRGVMNFRQSLDTRNAVHFEQQLENHLGFLDGQVHAVQRLLLRLQERLGTLAALIPLITLAVASVAFAFGSAIVASHCGSPVESTADLLDNGVAGPSRLRLCGFWPRLARQR